MSQRPPRAAKGPFARPFDVRSLKGETREVEITANEAERAAVAASTGLQDVADLAASFRVRPRAGGRIELTGEVRAAITQTCVVSLEPFDSLVRQPIEVAFAPTTAGSIRIHGHDVELPASAPVGGNDDQEDPPDPIVDDTIDLGATAVEFLVLGLDPYPRKPGVHFDDTVVGDKDDEPAPSAFAALARLKDDP